MFYYVKETSNKYQIKVFLISLIALIILTGAIIAFVSSFDKLMVSFPQLNSIKEVISNEINNLTPAGLFFVGFSGSLFFVPIAQEIFFYYSLIKGNSILVSFITINAGFFLAQIVNYFLGSKLNKFFFSFISKRKLYKARRFINKHGGIGVFLFNFLPLPAPLLTFALGIARYNIYRLLFYTLLGTALKYAVMILFYLAVT